MKSARFLIAENPIVGDGRVFIVHNREPVIIVEVRHFGEGLERERMEYRSRFAFGSTMDYHGELVALGAVFIAPLSPSWSTAERQADKLSKIINRMSDWYRAYLRWRDDNSAR
jgi:hypothetical protein